MIEGSYQEQYSELWDYGAELKRSNLRSTIEIRSETNSEGKPVFKRMYICFHGCRAGFANCRPMIGLDGYHVKGHHTGQLLAVIGIDAKNSMFLVTYTIVEAEGMSSWSWFLKFIKEDMDINNGYHWTHSDGSSGREG